jgi:hypothetical protein
MTTGPVWTFTTPANSPLPVNIISFKASAKNNDKVKLTGPLRMKGIIVILKFSDQPMECIIPASELCRVE